MANEWRKCVDWLVRCKVLSSEHRVTSDNARLQDLVNLLKDGVVICNLLNCLNPETLDAKDFSQRPQNSQFLCQKNINIFLQRCSSVFHIKDVDSFAVADLSGGTVTTFGKVLHMLSVLSHTPQAQKSKIAPFSLINESALLTNVPVDNDVEEDNDDDIYDRYLRPSSFDEDEKIYGFYVGVAPKKEDAPTKTRRDYCTEEIVETEKNYIEALEMINTKFMKPLKDCKDLLSSSDYEKIFMGNEKLLSIHRDFVDLLKKAQERKTTVTIPDCFMMFKEKFLFYGEFCSNLTGSQELLSHLCQKNAALRQKIIECQKAANEGKFKLHDLLAIPMQRVLKYHLLISELVRNTDEQDPERKSMERALEEMQDLSLFVNEVRRDHEILNTIALLEKSISDLPVNIVLRTCGRFQMDGEMKVRLQPDGATHTRHLFLFDKRLLLCKPTKSDTYSYKTSLPLSSYRVEDIRDKTSFQLSEVSGNKYLITAKNSDMRDKWRYAVLLAQENVCPPNAHSKKHDFQLASFDRPTICDVCRKYLRGFFFQGYLCQKTRMVAHKECLEIAKDMDGPPTPLPPRPKEKVVAIKTYNGQPSPPKAHWSTLKFNVNDVIDIIGSSGEPGWLEGELNSRRGHFPQSHVKALANRRNSVEPSISKSQDSQYINVSSSDIDIDAKPWYAGESTRDIANDKLDSLPEGSFMVRKSADGKGDHAISVQYNGVKHMKIGKIMKDNIQYCLVASMSFPSITDLVEFHSQNSLEKLFPDVKTPLILPYKNAQLTTRDIEAIKNKEILGFCVAKYDYAATAPNHLALKRGDRIAILSKIGDERGWWKGFHNGKRGFFPKSYVRE